MEREENHDGQDPLAWGLMLNLGGWLALSALSAVPAYLHYMDDGFCRGFWELCAGYFDHLRDADQLLGSGAIGLAQMPQLLALWLARGWRRLQDTVLLLTPFYFGLLVAGAAPGMLHADRDGMLMPLPFIVGNALFGAALLALVGVCRVGRLMLHRRDKSRDTPG